jgi:hypothetical protein
MLTAPTPMRPYYSTKISSLLRYVWKDTERVTEYEYMLGKTLRKNPKFFKSDVVEFPVGL